MKKNCDFSIREIDYCSSDGKKALECSENLYTTKMWIDFIISGFGKKANPCILEISLKNKSCIFAGIIFKKMGVKICGSPFEGWSTPYMGYIWLDSFEDDEKIFVLKGTIEYLQKYKKCLYIQISDMCFPCELLKKHHIKFDTRLTPFLDLTRSEQELYASFKGDVRTNSRNFLKRGAAFEVVEPTENFIVDYYNQLVDVFDKQGLESFYSKEKLVRFINAFKDYPNYIFCENAFLPDTKKSIATGIFLGYKERCFFFGNASYRKDQHYQPNEYIIWQGILHWKSQGCKTLDMCGVRSYKNKFRPTIVEYPIIYAQQLPFLHFLKNVAMKVVLKSRKK